VLTWEVCVGEWEGVCVVDGGGGGHRDSRGTGAILMHASTDGGGHGWLMTKRDVDAQLVTKGVTGTHTGLQTV
jgi:hypothetical protein